MDSKDIQIKELQDENKALKVELQKFKDNLKTCQQRYYDKNKATIRAQQNEYKRKIRQKETVKE